MGISKDGVRAYAGEYPAVFGAVCRAAQEAGLKVQEADSATGVITTKSSISLASWGETMLIKVWQEAPGTVHVSARSDLKVGLVDWGKNQKNLNKLFLRIDQAVAGSGPAPLPGVVAPSAASAAAAPEAGWQPDPTGRHEHRYWDGATWSDHVSDAGVAASDPYPG